MIPDMNDGREVNLTVIPEILIEWPPNWHRSDWVNG